MPSFEVFGHHKLNFVIFTSSALYLYNDVKFKLKMFDYGDYNLWLA